MPLKPDRLRFGDTLGIVAPASAPGDPQKIDLGIIALERLGFKAKPAKHLRKRWGFLAGTDRERSEDIIEMFRDPEIKGILCLRGGYGAARLLPLLDYEVIRKNPKCFIGYSDITSLHSAFFAKANLVSFHGPMLNSEFLNEKLPKFTRDSFLRTLMKPSAPGSLSQGYKKDTVEVLRPGVAFGRLVGGNISILCASLATPYQPSFKKVILFFEDRDEEPYRFDRMLTQLLNAGLLQEVAGVAVGINQNCKDPKTKKRKEYRQSLNDVLKERLLPLGIPIVTGLPFGHIAHNATVPIGVQAMLDANRGDLSITEAAVL
jgi:muramoyltetrapeptide carboxypeptidase